MLNFTPPLREIRFATEEVLAASASLQALPRFADIDTDTLTAIAEEVGRFAAERILPLNRSADTFGCQWLDGSVTTSPGFGATWNAYRELAWPSLSVETEFGGQGLPRLAFSILVELLASASHAFVMVASVNHCAIACLTRSGRDDLAASWIPRLASGEVLSSMCMSEPQAGSDVGLIRTRATRDEAGIYKISGSKIFASGGEHDLSDNIAHLVLARLPDAPPGSRGVSLFLVPKMLNSGTRNGVFCDGIESKMGLHGSPTCTLRFENAQGWLIGNENAGLHAMFPMMNEARLISGAQALGVSELALQNSLTYARERKQGRIRKGTDSCLLVEHPDVQRMLMIQKAWTEGARLLVHWSALLIDEAECHPMESTRTEAAALVGLLTPVVKGFLTENAQEATYLALQVYGGHGYVSETGIEQLVRDIRVTTIYEGTTGIQARDLLMRKVIAEDGRPFDVFCARIEQSCVEWGSNMVLAEFVVPLRKLLRLAQTTTSDLIERERAAPGSVIGACSGYLRLIGHLAFSWLWARAAAVSIGHSSDDSWYALKLETARFYYSHVMPEAIALSLQVASKPLDMTTLMSH